jgi:hypothetical protein
MHTEFWSVNLKGRNRLEDLDVNERIILKLIINKQDMKVYAGFIWPRTGPSVGLF